MRFTKTQLSEANEKARKRGFSEGRKVARRRGYFGFFFGLIFGVGGFYAYQTYQVEINQQVKYLVSEITGVKPTPETFVSKPTDMTDAEFVNQFECDAARDAAEQALGGLADRPK